MYCTEEYVGKFCVSSKGVYFLTIFHFPQDFTQVNKSNGEVLYTCKVSLLTQ